MVWQAAPLMMGELATYSPSSGRSLSKGVFFLISKKEKII